MDKTQLITLVAAILAKDQSEESFFEAAKRAERLVHLIANNEHMPASNWDGNVKFV